MRRKRKPALDPDVWLRALALASPAVDFRPHGHHEVHAPIAVREAFGAGHHQLDVRVLGYSSRGLFVLGMPSVLVGMLRSQCPSVRLTQAFQKAWMFGPRINFIYTEPRID